MVYKIKIGYRRWITPDHYEYDYIFEGLVNNEVNSLHLFYIPYRGKEIQLLKELFDYMFFKVNGFMDGLVVKVGYATFHGANAYKAVEEIRKGKTPWELRNKYNVTFIPED